MALMLVNACSCGQAAFRSELYGGGEEAGFVFSVNTVDGAAVLLITCTLDIDFSVPAANSIMSSCF